MNDLKTSIFIAYKSILRGSKFTLVFLVFILSLLFVNMMFIAGIMQGFQQTIPQMTIDELSSDIIIRPQEKPQFKEFIMNQTNLRKEIESIPGVLATGRRYSLGGSVSFDKDKNGQYKSLSAPIMGIDPVDDAKVLGFKKLMRYGEFLTDTDTDQIILSSAFAGGYGDIAAESLGGAKVGDKVNVTYANGAIKTYTVKGIYHDDMALMENFISTREAESILGVHDEASQILVKVDLSLNTLDTYHHKIAKLVPNLKIHTYLDEMGSFGSFMNALNLMTVILSAVSIAVAAITVFVLFYINAIHKKRQIGILKAIGIKQKVIVYSYMFQSLFYTLVSLLVGSLITFGILYPILMKYPLDVDFGKVSLIFNFVQIALSMIFFAVAGILAGIVPSRIVSKEDILTMIWG